MQRHLVETRRRGCAPAQILRVDLRDPRSGVDRLKQLSWRPERTVLRRRAHPLRQMMAEARDPGARLRQRRAEVLRRRPARPDHVRAVLRRLKVRRQRLRVRCERRRGVRDRRVREIRAMLDRRCPMDDPDHVRAVQPVRAPLLLRHPGRRRWRRRLVRRRLVRRRLVRRHCFAQRRRRGRAVVVVPPHVAAGARAVGVLLLAPVAREGVPAPEQLVVDEVFPYVLVFSLLVERELIARRLVEERVHAVFQVGLDHPDPGDVLAGYALVDRLP